MKHQPKAWIVAYDIREPRRLRRVHRTLRKEGVAAQYSVFTVEADDEGIARLLQRLRGIIDERVDDVRAYHLPAHCAVWALGTQHWPDGVSLAGMLAARLITEAASQPAPAGAEPVSPST